MRLLGLQLVSHNIINLKAMKFIIQKTALL